VERRALQCLYALFCCSEGNSKKIIEDKPYLLVTPIAKNEIEISIEFDFVQLFVVT
jgi:hypothetical protein